MGDKTGISWTDASWNPIRGCSRVSDGCVNCYAEVQAARIVRMGKGKATAYDGLVKNVLRATGYTAPNGEPEMRHEARWTGVVRLVPEQLAWPLRKRKPLRIFVNSMSDLFHEKLTNEQIAAVFGVMAACPQHTFQCLTKRPARMREFLTHPEVRCWIAKAKDAALVEQEHDARERWKAIPDLPLYEASSHGRIRNHNTKAVLQPQLNEHKQIGRYAITVYDDGEPSTQFVHRLVLRAFVGKPNFGEEGCHRNGNKTDNRLANLRWGTRSENQQDKVRHGSRGGPAKLTPEQVVEIRKRRAAGDTQQTVADAFGVSRSLISMIESGDVWAEPDMPWPLPNVWIGVSVENQEAADERIPELLRTPAAVRFLSCEPLLSGLSLERYLRCEHDERGDRTSCTGGHGVVCSGQDGRDLAPLQTIEWQRVASSATDRTVASGARRSSSDERLSAGAVHARRGADTGLCAPHRVDGDQPPADPAVAGGESHRRPQGEQHAAQLGIGDEARQRAACAPSTRTPVGTQLSGREAHDHAGPRDPQTVRREGVSACGDREDVRSISEDDQQDRATQVVPAGPRISWVICGCESGPGARPCEVDWLRSLRDQCAAAGVAYFCKQAVETADGLVTEGPDEPGGYPAVWCGDGSKRKPGGVIELPYLDGVQWAQFPEVRP